MKIVITGIIIFAFLALSTSAQSNTLTDQEQQIYSLILADFADWVVHTDPSAILVLSPTAPINSNRRNTPPNVSTEIYNLWNMMIRISETPKVLPATLGSKQEYRVISNTENDQKSLRLGKRSRINRIKRRFPKTELLILLSRIGFDDLKGFAMVSIERWGTCETCGAQGRTYLLTKVNCIWTIAKNWAWYLH